jgi:hypothetical protein
MPAACSSHLALSPPLSLSLSLYLSLSLCVCMSLALRPCQPRTSCRAEVCVRAVPIDAVQQKSCFLRSCLHACSMCSQRCSTGLAPVDRATRTCLRLAAVAREQLVLKRLLLLTAAALDDNVH